MPDGDILIHAGDLSMTGDEEELRPVCDWLASLPYEHIVVIAGNHDLGLQNDPQFYEPMFPPNVTYLRDSGVTINGLKFWGSPWQHHYKEWAFHLAGESIKQKWSLIPDDTDVLVTHTPMFERLDWSLYQWDQWEANTHVGCHSLRERADQLNLKLHVAGHIHEARGQLLEKGTLFVNASICDRTYKPDNLEKPIVIEVR